MKERNEIDPALFSTGAHILEKSNNGTKYQIECDTPNGTMQCIHLFPGIDLAYTSFQAFSCFSRNKAMPHILEIAYCSAGRYECEYKRDYFTYLGEGDIAISVLSPHREPPTFPTGLYDGVALIVDMSVTGNQFKDIVEGISIDLSELTSRFCTDRCCTVVKAPPELNHVFQEVCEEKNKKRLGYLRLKALEIFFLLSEILPQENLEVSVYYPGSTIRKIKELKQELMDSLDTRYSLAEWAACYGLSLTTMKDCFKAIYGKPIYAFQKEYKIQMAAQLLLTTQLSISEIAGKIGYSNPNKFSSAFRSIIGMSPREYRNTKK